MKKKLRTRAKTYRLKRKDNRSTSQGAPKRVSAEAVTGNEANPSSQRRVRKLRLKRRRPASNGKTHVSSGAGTKKAKPAPWVSPDGDYCNTAYASLCIGKSVSRLQSMRSEGAGPNSIK